MILNRKTLLRGILGTSLPIVSSVRLAPLSAAQCLLATEVARFTGGMAGDNLGRVLAVSGDTVVIGSNAADASGGRDAGAAYVFVYSDGAWAQQVQLTAADGAANDSFGVSVAISGDTIVVGAFGADSPAGSNSGAVYIYTRSGAEWSQQAKLTASNAAAYDGFGWSVGISGDTIVVGADIRTTSGGIGAGGAYVYRRIGGTWSEEAHLTARDGMAGDHFGDAVAVSADTIVIGAYGADTQAGADAGAAYVFSRSDGRWDQQSKLTAADGAPGDYFSGFAVAIEEDTIVIGAGYADTAAGLDAGAAYVFTRSGANWSQQTKLTAADGAGGEHFGYSVAISEDALAIGADGRDTSELSNSGTVYVFTRAGDGWRDYPAIGAGDGRSGDRFGYVGLSGDRLAVGAVHGDVSAGDDAGRASFFDITRMRAALSTGAATISPEDKASFSVTVTGGEPIAYHWRHNGTVIDPALNPSAATSTLELESVSVADTGSYDCLVLDACGELVSETALLTVQVPEPAAPHARPSGPPPIITGPTQFLEWTMIPIGSGHYTPPRRPVDPESVPRGPGPGSGLNSDDLDAEIPPELDPCGAGACGASAFSALPLVALSLVAERRRHRGRMRRTQSCSQIAHHRPVP